MQNGSEIVDASTSVGKEVSADTGLWHGPGGIVLWLARLTALGALVIAGYLLAVSLGSIPSVAGCGEDGVLGCDQVLSSRWSRWFDLPVVLPGIVVYALAFLALFGICSKRRLFQSLSLLLLVVLAVPLIVMAGWFLGLQWLVIKRLCWYCAAAHACGLFVAAFVVCCGPMPWQMHFARQPDSGTGLATRTTLACLVVGLVGSATLIAGQVLVAPRPRDWQIVNIVGPAGKPITLDVRAFPRLGSPQAKYVVVEMLDYTCLHCRTMSAYLEQARKRYGSQLAILPLVVPLHPTRNRYIKTLNPRNEHASEYARLALAVWQANPGAFETFHRWLIESDHSLASAKEHAASLVGTDALDKATTLGDLDRQIQKNVEIYGQFGAGNLPLLIYDKQTARGEPANAQQLFDFLEKYVGLSP